MATAPKTAAPRETVPATPVSVVDVDRPVLSKEDLMTEQEKAAAGAGKAEKKKNVKLGDTEAEEAPGQGEAYPEGSPPDPDVLFEQIHGFKKSDL